jgi:hypothetical protein
LPSTKSVNAISATEIEQNVLRLRSMKSDIFKIGIRVLLQTHRDIGDIGYSFSMN